MLARIPKLRRSIESALLCALAIMFASCASQKESVRLVNDPDDHHESMIPWNKQESWETGGQFAGMTDRR
jgi:hypothetical protein